MTVARPVPQPGARKGSGLPSARLLPAPAGAVT